MTLIKDLNWMAPSLAVFVLSGLGWAALPARAGDVSRVWVADQGDGTYRNPVLHGDYSDPDLIRVEKDYYLVSSSFHAVPGIPVLHSRDLVNWELIGHALAQQPPIDYFSKVRPGQGVWAPSLRYHHSEFYLYYPDPDRGIYLVKAPHPAGPWSAPQLIKEAKGWIDPCPFWDDDASAYLINALAASRSGIKSTLLLSRMAPDGQSLLGEPMIIFDGHAKHPIVEGPKLYKRNGYYYIFAPAGGVATCWQLVLRSRRLEGPYEEKVTLHQGSTSINGPHQGGWVETPGGESWFMHFQDQGAYGRVVHLQPMSWVDDWPRMGTYIESQGIGEPVLRHKKPDVGFSYPIQTPPDSDEFNGPTLGLQWQWLGNPNPLWALPSVAYGALRLTCVVPSSESKNLTDAPNLLLQKFPAPAFCATTKVSFSPKNDGEKTGLIVLGSDYATLSLVRKAEGLFLVQTLGLNALKGAPEKEAASQAVSPGPVYLQVRVAAGGECRFSFSTDGRSFTPIGEKFTATAGNWIGAKLGIYAQRSGPSYEAGYGDFDWFRFEP